MVTVDLSKAFDSAKRNLVEASIADLNLDEDLDKAIRLFLQEGACEIEHKGQKGQVNSSRGLKQGSKNAPFEWNLLTIHLLKAVAQRKGLKWLQQHVIIYADDMLLKWNFHSQAFF